MTPEQCSQCGEAHIDKSKVVPWTCAREPAGHSRCCRGCPNHESHESIRLRTALEGMAQAIRDRYRCRFGPLECGGVCCLPKGHSGDVHLCDGDEDGVPGTCPA